jgi:endonuclease/exonuclease/phosphatase family metal-dependent hydrolase
MSKTAKVPHVASRANWLGVGWLISMLFGEQDHDIQSRSPNVQTVTSGPLGLVYFLNEEVKSRRDEFANRLASEFDVPMVVQAIENDRAKVSTADGCFVLPEDAVSVFGADHPFLDDVARDLIALVQHPDAGDLVLVGWTRERQSISFVLQNGAHAGPGVEETSAFVLLPGDIDVGDPDKRHLRPDNLRRAALRFLGREPAQPSYRTELTCRDEAIRIMTYNVHACVGMDGELSPERIARVIDQSGANVICLQELDVFRRRSGNRDQAHAIALHLEMNHKFHPAWHLEEESFGNAILTRFPMRMVEMKGLHHHKSDRSRRSALWAEIDVNEELSLQLINTHLSIYPKEQLIQARELMEEWVQPASLLGPVVLCGDFNARPNSATHKAFAGKMFDVESFDQTRTRSTYFSPFPMARFDHIFVTRGLLPVNTQVIDSRIAKVASDHLPLIADLKFDRASAGFDCTISGANQSIQP